MQLVELFIFFALCEIEFATDEDGRIGRGGQSLLHFFGGQRGKLREKSETSLANCFTHRPIADVGEKNERSGSAKFLALEKQRRPRTEQEQCGHCPIAAG